VRQLQPSPILPVRVVTPSVGVIVTCVVALHPPRKPFGSIADVPCHAGSRTRTFVRAGDPAPRTLFTDSAPTPPLPRPETPSTDRSRLSHAPCWREEHDPVGRHWYLGFAAETQLPTRIHAQRCALDPFT
jgi:hypothetical protein